MALWSALIVPGVDVMGSISRMERTFLKRHQQPRPPSVGNAQFDAGRGGNKVLNTPRDRINKACTVVGRGGREEPAM